VSKVTSKLQVTIPKRIADRYGISPGDEIAWIAAGDSIRVVPAAEAGSADDTPSRLELFDAATARQRKRQAALGELAEQGVRGWSREDLYTRGRAG
jgi:AbrB family looped-hinge helix DNA binding protein